jgi:CRP-like cAMP-binding protein
MTGMRPIRRFSPDTGGVLESTLFASLPEAVAASLLEQAVETTFRAGSVFYRGAHHADTAMFGFVIDGLLHFYIHAPDGRSMTVRYATRGEIIGARGLALELTGEEMAPLGASAVNGAALRDARILTLPRSAVIDAARSSAAFSWELLRVVSTQAARHEELLAANVFSPIRSRVALHLINLAVHERDQPVVNVSHQEIANAIGTAREVVSRTLCHFEEEGLLRRRGRRLMMIDEAGLRAASRP